MLDAINIFCEPTVSVNDIAAIRFDSYTPNPVPYGQPYVTFYGVGFSSLPQPGYLTNADAPDNNQVTVISDNEIHCALGATPHQGTFAMDYTDGSGTIYYPAVISVTFA